MNATENFLWTFSWNGGGYNQVYASNRRAARAKIVEEFSGGANLTPDLSTLKKLSPKQTKQYWKDFPRMD